MELRIMVHPIYKKPMKKYTFLLTIKDQLCFCYACMKILSYNPYHKSSIFYYSHSLLALEPRVIKE